MNILNRFSIKTKLSFVIIILGLLSLIFIIQYETSLYNAYAQSKQISNYSEIAVHMQIYYTRFKLKELSHLDLSTAMVRNSLQNLQNREK